MLGLVDLVKASEHSVIATVFFLEFGQLGGGGFKLGGQLVNVGLLFGEQGGHQRCLGRELSGSKGPISDTRYQIHVSDQRGPVAAC